MAKKAFENSKVDVEMTGKGAAAEGSPVEEAVDSKQAEMSNRINPSLDNTKTFPRGSVSGKGKGKKNLPLGMKKGLFGK